MTNYKLILAGAMVWTLSCPSGVSAQSPKTIDPGTMIEVRTNEEIRASTSDGRVFSGEVARDVLNRNGNIAIPRGSNVELLVRNVSKDEIALDLESVDVRGERYGIDTEDSVVTSNPGVGANKRTGEYVGGGAAIGAIIGAIAGGGKGAVIGGGVGAIAGANAQIMTRGKSVEIPPESLLTFRLERPLRLGAGDRGFDRDGQHYHPGYDVQPPDSPAYQDGFQAGRSDAERKQERNARSDRWNGEQEFRDYQAGYEKGYQERSGESQPEQREVPGLRIGADHNISWQGAPPNAQVYAQTDNSPKKLFASGASGNAMAPWIVPGHTYTFILQDANGNEIARQQLDLRRGRGPE